MQWPLASQEGLLVLILHICFVGAEWEAHASGCVPQRLLSQWNAMALLPTPLRPAAQSLLCWACSGGRRLG